jgi:hypothetical protein
VPTCEGGLPPASRLTLGKDAGALVLAAFSLPYIYGIQASDPWTFVVVSASPIAPPESRSRLWVSNAGGAVAVRPEFPHVEG